MRIGLSLIFISLLTIAGLKIPSKPNIIIILVDDLGYGELGCYGQSVIKTPYIDLLARSGLRFNQYYAGNDLTADKVHPTAAGYEKMADLYFKVLASIIEK